MASILLSDLTLDMANITGRRKTSATAVDARERRKIDPETRKRTQELEGYAVDILAAHGRPQTVKLPIDSQKTVEAIMDAISKNMTVTVDFGTPSTLKGRCYAINNGGQLVAGVSASATTINILNIESEDDDFDDGTVDL